MRVTEGIFALTEGKTIDLTNDRVLLIFVSYQSNTRIEIKLNGTIAGG
jgi:hypothetical protein